MLLWIILITNITKYNLTDRCACMENDHVWRTDSGNIRLSKDHLPLIQIQAGDTDKNSEEIKYTLGPLECTC